MTTVTTIQPPTVAIPTAATGSLSAQVTAQASTTNTSTAAIPSPQTVFDASTGTVITQFLSSSGTLQSQTPSAVSVAYLRAGLTKDGWTASSLHQSHNATASVGTAATSQSA